MTEVHPSCLLPPIDEETFLGQTFSPVEDIAGLWGIYPDLALTIIITTLLIALISSALFFSLAIIYWYAQYQVRHRWNRWWSIPIVRTVNFVDDLQNRAIVLYNEAKIPRLGVQVYKVWEMFIAMIVATSCVLLTCVLIRVPYYDCFNHALEMFQEPDNYVTEGIFSIFIGLHMGINWLLSKRLFVYWLTPINFFTLISVVSGLSGLYNSQYMFWFMNFRFINLWVFFNDYMPKDTNAWKVIHVLFLVLTVQFTTSSYIYAFESSSLYEKGMLGDLIDAWYMISTTLCTCGYGDLTPKSTAGKLFIALMMIGAMLSLGFIIAFFQKLLAGMKQSPIYWSSDHTILFIPQAVDPTTFVEQFFHPDRGESPHKLVIVTPEKQNIPKQFLNMIRNDANLKIRIRIIYGDIFDSEHKALIKLDTAQSVVFYAPFNVFNESERSQFDALTLLRTTAAQQSCRADITIHALTLTRQGKESLAFQDVHNVVCLPEITAKLLALQCKIPGTLPLISNLVRTVAAEDDPEALDELYHTQENQWMKEYELGLGMEFYQFILDPVLAGKNFQDLCKDWYETRGFLMLGLRRGKHVCFNPSTEKILKGDIGLFLAADWDIVFDGIQETIAENASLGDKTIAMSLMNSLQMSATSSKAAVLTYLVAKKMKKTFEVRRNDFVGQRVAVKAPPLDISDHILICGDIGAAVQHFVDLMGPKEKFVLLSYLPENQIDISWARAKKYKRVYYLYGDMTVRKTLKHAGAHRAKKVVILPSYPTDTHSHSCEMPDAKATVAYKLVNSLNPGRDIATVVFSSEDSINALLPDYKNEDVLGELLDAGPTRNPKWAAGQVFLQPVLDMFLVTDILNNELLPVISLLMKDGVLTSFTLDSKQFSGQFSQAPSYGDLFKFLFFVKGFLPIALYRKREFQKKKDKKEKKEKKEKKARKQERIEYIFTTPPWDVQTRLSDVVICLCNSTHKI